MSDYIEIPLNYRGICAVCRIPVPSKPEHRKFINGTLAKAEAQAHLMRYVPLVRENMVEEFLLSQVCSSLRSFDLTKELLDLCASGKVTLDDTPDLLARAVEMMESDMATSCLCIKAEYLGAYQRHCSRLLAALGPRPSIRRLEEVTALIPAMFDEDFSSIADAHHLSMS
jgi:hypothetical protein